MRCKFCGSEIRDNVNFCTACGRKTSDTVCSVCGAYAEADEVFCGNCGARLGGAATETVGVAKSAAAAAAAERNGASAAGSKLSAKKVLNTVSAAFIVATAALLLIFVSFIGISMKGSGLAVSESMWIADYFGRAYTEIAEAIDSLNTMLGSKEQLSAYFVFTLYLPTVLSTITLAATMALVAVFSVFALVKGIGKLCGKEVSGAYEWVVRAFVSYIAGAALIKSYASGDVGGGAIKVSWNAATIAGIALCACMFGIAIACRFAARGKELLNEKAIVGGVLSVVGAVFAAVVLGLIASPAYGMAGATVGYLSMLTAIGMTGSTFKEFAKLENVGVSTGMIITAVLLSVIVAAIAAHVLRRNCTALVNKDQRASFVPNIALAVMSVALLVFAVVGGNLCMDVLGAADEMHLSFANSAVTLVMTMLSLGVSVTHFCLEGYFSKPRPPKPVSYDAE